MEAELDLIELWVLFEVYAFGLLIVIAIAIGVVALGARCVDRYRMGKTDHFHGMIEDIRR